MTYYPTFSVVNEKKAPFDLQAYEQMFEEVEKADRPEAYPFSAPLPLLVRLLSSHELVLDARHLSPQSTASAMSTSTACCSCTRKSTSSTSTGWRSCR